MNEQELNKKLAEWAGFYDTGHIVIDNWRTPDGKVSLTVHELPNFTQSLDASFMWLVPKLRIDNKYPYLTEIILDPTMCETEMYYCYLRYESLHDDDCIEREEAQSSAETPALALCLAIEKLIDEEVK